MDTHEVTVLCRTTLNYAFGSFGGPAEIAIRDGRTSALPGWQTCGFELMDHDSDVEDWTDDDEISRVHYAEMASLAQHLTGCDHAVVAGHIKRNPEQAKQHSDLAPIALVHSDFADSYGDKLREGYRNPSAEMQAALGRAGVSAAEAVVARRLLVLQFWRNLGPTKMDLPLAWCDARTVPRGDTHAFPVTNYAGGGFNFDALGIARPSDPSRHQWYGFAEMRVDETVAFRTYDTDRVATGEPYWTPHSAYRDPEVALGKPSRSSIELRATCLFL